MTGRVGVRLFVNHEYDCRPTKDDTKSHYQLIFKYYNFRGLLKGCDWTIKVLTVEGAGGGGGGVRPLRFKKIVTLKIMRYSNAFLSRWSNRQVGFPSVPRRLAGQWIAWITASVSSEQWPHPTGRRSGRRKRPAPVVRCPAEQNCSPCAAWTWSCARLRSSRQHC